MTVATIYSVSQAGAEPSMASVPALAKFMENGNLAGSQGPIRRRGAGWRSATAQRWVAHLSPTEQKGPCNFATSRVRQNRASIAHDRVSPGLFGTANSMTTIFAGPSAGPFSESEDAALIYHAMREGDAVQSAAMMVVSNVRERTSGRRAA